MKRNKVLLGLYAGLLTLAGGVANAQSGKFYEIGPDNVGGEVSCLVVDNRDTSRNTLFAGAATGGLFIKSESVDILRNLYMNLGVSDSMFEVLVNNHDTWHHVPFYQNGKEVSLPISCMAQAPSGELFIGTGSDDYAYGSTYGKMSRKGMGLYRYIPLTNEFVLIPTTSTANDTSFNVINCVLAYHDGDALYLYVGTNSGLYRWLMMDGNDNWSATPTKVFPGRVDEMVISRPNKTGFFSSGNQLYRIGNVTATPSNLHPINISSSNAAFGGSNTAIKLAVSQTDSTFLYAMVINQYGRMEALYMTNNEQTWYPLSTSTVMPITYNDGRMCGAIAIDPQNPRRVIIGGTTVMVGEGYSDGAYFQWTTSSASEHELNFGDYMATVFNNTSFVHSGIHQIVPVYHIDGVNDYHTVFFATDGGVYSSKFYGHDGFDTVMGVNRGLNNMQINGLAVCPDGSLIMGANDNACPIVETHLTHFGGEARLSWYDDGRLGNLNHDANVIWTDNGGAVAASAFQQVYPTARRTIFTSSANGNIGRTYADYLDYTNTTTWTTGEGFLTDQITGGPAIGSLALWETENNTAFNSYVTMGVDTLGYIFRQNGNRWDTIWVNDTAYGANRGGNFQIRRGDKVLFHSRGHADYPFEYTFQSPQRAKDSVTVLNPIQSRMVCVGDFPAAGMGATESDIRAIWYSWQPTDFTKVWSAGDYQSAIQDTPELHNRLHYWAPIYGIQRSAAKGTLTHYPRQAVFSNDGLYVYVSVYDEATHQSMLVRISGFENVDFSKNNHDVKNDLNYSNQVTILQYDTLRYNNSVWMPRAISNITYDGRNGADRLVLTFEDYSNAMTNVAIVENAGTTPSFTEIPLTDITLPAYCAIVEDSTGAIYVGTEDGVYVKRGSNGWQAYSNLSGVPVTNIVQQTHKMPIRHNLTHTGITANNFVFAKTKWPRAIYFATYGRGVFMDMQYVTDTTNEVVDSVDFEPVGIPTVHGTGMNSVSLFPNPVTDEANLTIAANVAGIAVVRVYDINGRMVKEQNLGYVAEGESDYTLDCTGMSKGMYLVNVIISGHTAATKMVVR